MDSLLSLPPRLTPWSGRTQLAAPLKALLAMAPNQLGRTNCVTRDASFVSPSSSQGGDLDIDRFGSAIPTKGDHTLRIGFQNIGGFSVLPNSLKDDTIHSGLKLYKFDIFGMVETNIDWRLVPEHKRLQFCTRDWWQSLHISYSLNCTDTPICKVQYGGTALFSCDKAAHRVISKGIDPSPLGRWCWTRYKEKNSHFLRLVTAYRPNPLAGPYTV